MTRRESQTAQTYVQLDLLDRRVPGLQIMIKIYLKITVIYLAVK
jgi:hypothetical protein